jgi:hypothetical protein
VAGDRVDHLLTIVRERGPQVRSDGEVTCLAVTSRQGLVGDLAQDLLREPVAATLGRQRIGGDLEHLATQQVAQDRFGGVRIEARHRRQRLCREARTQHRCIRDDSPGGRIERVETRCEQCVEAVGHAEFADVTDEAVAPIDGLHDVTVDQRPDALHRIQRNPLGVLDDHLPTLRCRARDQRIDELIHRRRIQRVQRDRHPVAAGPEPGATFVDVGPGEHQHEDRQITRPIDQMVEEVQQLRSCVVGVLDQDRHRRRSRQLFEQPPPTCEQVLTSEGHLRVRTVSLHTQQTSQPRGNERPIGEVGHILVETLVQLVVGNFRRVVLRDAEALTHHLCERPVHQSVAVGQASSPVPVGRVDQPVDVLLELPTQPGLAHPGRARHQHQSRLATLDRRVEQLAQRPDLRAATRQRRLQPIDTLRPADTGHHTLSAPQSFRLGSALEDMFTLVDVADRLRRQPPSHRVDPHRSRRRRRLDPSGRVHRITGHHALVRRADRHRHLTGQHTRPGSELRNAGRQAQLGDRIHQIQRRPDRPLGILLGRHRRTPYRHHRITDELLHHTAVAADDRRRDLEVAAQQLADILRVTNLRHRREPDQVHEQHRTQPPLRHRTRIGDTRRRRCLLASTYRVGVRRNGPHRGAAVATEPLTRLDRRPARRTRQPQRRTTLTTEPLVVRALGPASTALHARLLRREHNPPDARGAHARRRERAHLGAASARSCGFSDRSAC